MYPPSIIPQRAARRPLHFCKPLPTGPAIRLHSWAKALLLELPFLALLLLLSAFYLRGLAQVPFHPDESTQLFMSADFEQLWADPGSLAGDLAHPDDPRQRYRLLDAPLSRYLIGLGRSLARLPAPPADWDWSESWHFNQQSGALPDGCLLWIGRLSLAVLYPFSLFFTYRSGCALAGRPAGLLSILLLGTHALVLLHTRRAMAEGPLLFGTTFILAILPRANQRPALAGLACALAFNAKHAALPLVAVSLLAAAWPPGGLLTLKPGLLAANLARCLGAFLLLSLALNPVLWQQPLGAAHAALQSRRELLQRQLADAARVAPGQVLENPAERALGLLAHLYLAPPMFSETANYRQETTASEAAYLAFPGHWTGRSLPGSGALLAITLLGLYRVGRMAWVTGPRQRTARLFLVAAGCQATALAWTVPLAWQRYSLPLVPFAALLAGVGLALILASLQVIWVLVRPRPGSEAISARE